MMPRRNARVLEACGGVALAVLAFAAGASRPAQQAVPAAAPAQATAADARSTRHQQLADDSAQLLKAATVLKSEVDKTSKDMLSITVIRRAEAVEKMARAIRERHGAAR